MWWWPSRGCVPTFKASTDQFFLPSLIGTVGTLPLARRADTEVRRATISASPSEAAESGQSAASGSPTLPPPVVLPSVLPNIRKSRQGSILVDPRRIKKGNVKVATEMWKAKSWPSKLLARLADAKIQLNEVGFAVHPTHGYERVRLYAEDVDKLLAWLAANFMHAEVETDPTVSMAAL